jgi:hypothetical protein
LTENISKESEKRLKLKVNRSNQIDYRTLSRCVDYFRKSNAKEKRNLDREIYPVVSE